MSEDIFYNHIVFTLICIGGLIIVNYFLKILIVKVYLSHPHPYVVYEKDIVTVMRLAKDKNGNIKVWAPEKIIVFILTLLFYWGIWTLLHRNPEDAEVGSKFFAYMSGCILIPFCFILMAMVEMWYILKKSKTSHVLTGQMQFVRWFHAKVASYRYLKDAIFCFFLFCVTGCFLFLGGTSVYLIAFYVAYIQSSRIQKKSLQEGQ